MKSSVLWGNQKAKTRCADRARKRPGWVPVQCRAAGQPNLVADGLAHREHTALPLQADIWAMLPLAAGVGVPLLAKGGAVLIGCCQRLPGIVTDRDDPAEYERIPARPRQHRQ
jgi:hypothetical protein